MRPCVTRWCGLVLSVWILSLLGCSSASYQGYSPSARTFSESPGMRDYYVGMNVNFSVDRPTEYRHGASSETGTVLAVPEGSSPNPSIAPPVATVN